MLYCGECGYSCEDHEISNEVSLCPECGECLSEGKPLHHKESNKQNREVICTKCYQLNSSHTNNCLRCGADLRSQSGLTACQKCSHKVSPRAVECPKCSNLLKKECSVCHRTIPSFSKLCPQCGDPEPFEEPKKFITCLKCGDRPSNAMLTVCLRCGEPLPEEISKYELTKCSSCKNQLSERATCCPKCKTSTSQPCQICGETIATWLETCPECGDPEPFELKETVKSHSNSQGTTDPVTRLSGLKSVGDASQSLSKPEVVHKSQQTHNTKGKVRTPDIAPLEILFSFDGRITRQQFWTYMLPIFGVIIISSLLLQSETVLIRLGRGNALGVYLMIALLTLLPSLAIQVKRWHDRNKSWYWVLLNCIPLVSIWVWIELGFFKGTTGSNKYGEDPLQ